MSRYRGPKLRIIRKLGDLPGFTSKTTERLFPPGQHGPGKAGRKSSLSEYGIRLQEKQKLRYNYGVTEKQLLSYVRRARRAKGPTGEVLLQMLEMRLDSVVFRLGFAPTIRAARQYVSHGLIKVDGKRVNIPSYNCAQGETITSTSTPVVENCKTFGGTVPSHLSVDTNKTTGTIQRAITRSQIALTVNELLIIEFYSRKG